MIDKFEISKKAALIRDRLGEDDHSPLDIFSLVQSQLENTSLAIMPLGDNISGICVKLDGSAVIGINSAMSLGRQRFSLAHELYHYYFDDSMSAPSALTIGGADETEQKADQFASYLLLPPLALDQMLEEEGLNDKHIEIKDVIKMEQLYGLSHKAMLFRLLDEGYITKQEHQSLLSNVISEATRLGFSTHLYKAHIDKPARTFGFCVKTAEDLYESGVISAGKYDEYLLDANRDDIVYGLEEEGADIID